MIDVKFVGTNSLKQEIEESFPTCFRTRKRLFLLLVTWGVLSGCSNRDVSPVIPPPREHLILRETSNPTTLDPAFATRAFEGQLACLTHAGLVRCNEQGEIIPELAEKWDIQDGGREFLFRLKEGLVFPSRRGLTAADVVYSFQRLCAIETGSPMAWIFEDVRGYQDFRTGKSQSVIGFSAVDDQTVRIELTEPSATLLARLTMPAARVVDHQQIDLWKERYGRNPASLGAWMLSEWEDDSHLRMVPNPNYPGHNPHLEVLEFKIVSQDFMASALFQTGGIHLLSPLPPSQSLKWNRSEKWRKNIRIVPQMNLYYLGFNCTSEPFDDPKIRRWIKENIQIDEIRRVTWGKLATAASSPIPPGLVGHVGFEPLENTVPKPPQVPSEVELWFVESDTTTTVIMEAIQFELKKIGISCRLRPTDSNTYTLWRREKRFSLFYGNWWADYPDPDNFMAPLFHSKSSSNHTGYNQPKVDQLIEKAAKESDPRLREKLYQAANELIQEEAPMIFLWHRNAEVLSQSWVQGYTAPSLYQGTLFLDVKIQRSSNRGG